MQPRVRQSLAATGLVLAALLMNGCGGCTGNNWREGVSGVPPAEVTTDARVTQKTAVIWITHTPFFG